MLGYPPLLLDLEAVQDTDHVLAIYRERGHWGAIAKSNFSGLRFRAPVYRTLRAYSRPVNLARFDRGRPCWETSDGDVWFVAEHLARLPHTRLLQRGLERRLGRVDRRSLEAGLVGFRQK